MCSDFALLVCDLDDLSLSRSLLFFSSSLDLDFSLSVSLYVFAPLDAYDPDAQLLKSLGRLSGLSVEEAYPAVEVYRLAVFDVVAAAAAAAWARAAVVDVVNPFFEGVGAAAVAAGTVPYPAASLTRSYFARLVASVRTS